jgi:hypothetical protein
MGRRNGIERDDYSPFLFCRTSTPDGKCAKEYCALEPDGARKDPSVHHHDARRGAGDIKVDLRGCCSRLRRIRAPRLSSGRSVWRPAYVW